MRDVDGRPRCQNGERRFAVLLGNVRRRVLHFHPRELGGSTSGIGDGEGVGGGGGQSGTGVVEEFQRLVASVDQRGHNLQLVYSGHRLRSYKAAQDDGEYTTDALMNGMNAYRRPSG